MCVRVCVCFSLGLGWLLFTVAYVCVYWPRLVIMCVVCMCVCVCVFCFGLSLVGYCVSCVLLGLFYVFTLIGKPPWPWPRLVILTMTCVCVGVCVCVGLDLGWLLLTTKI